MKIYLPIRENASELILIMMVAGIVALLSARMFLELANYPQIGGGDWHLAHALPGGMLMVVGMVLGLIVHGEKYRRTAAGVFGVGVGWFIDETGKYLSTDNDYFFQPAIVLMYIFFILIFLLYRFLDKIVFKNPKILLYQAMADLEEIAERDLEKREKRDLIEKLDKIIKKADPKVKIFVVELKKLIKRVETIEDKQEKWSKKMWKNLKRFSYHKVFKKKFVLYLLVFLALFYIIGGIYDSVYFWHIFLEKELWGYWYKGVNLLTRTDTIMFSLKALFDFLTSIFFGIGILLVARKKKKSGLIFFQHGLLVNIFLSSVFKFYFEQFSAIFSLMASVVVLTGLGRLRKERII